MRHKTSHSLRNKWYSKKYFLDFFGRPSLDPGRLKAYMEEFDSYADQSPYKSVLAGDEAEMKLADTIQETWNTKCDTIEVYQYQFYASKPSLEAGVQF